MGQKCNPISNRLGIVKGWDSNWFGGKNFGDNILEDNKIRKYLNARLAKASISKIYIERTLKMLTVTINAARPGLIIAGSLSKILGTPGIRLGYICADPETVLLLWRRLFPWPLDAFATEIAAQLPEHMDEIRTDAKLNTARRSAFAKQLTKLGAEVFPSESNFLLVDFHRDMIAAADLLRSRGILVRSCSSFGLPDSYWRLAVRTEADNTRLINELEEILHVR